MDHCVPDMGSPVLSPMSSPTLLHSSSPLLKKKSREIKSPAKLQNGEQRRFKISPSSSPTSSPRILSTRPSPCASDNDEDQDVLVLAKRRKLNYDNPSYTPSPCDSPTRTRSMLNLSSANTSFDDGVVPASLLLAEDFGDLESTDTSGISTPAISPSPSTSSFQLANRKKGDQFRGRYKKDELWPAIEVNYQFLMDKEIIETCRSTESDLSWESDDVTNTATTVSFNEFLQQYKELTDWLSHIQNVTQRRSDSLSEKYLNQTYHEEMLQRSPRRKLFNDYAKQLMRRYPNRKDEVVLRLQHLNKKWHALETAISSQGGHTDQKLMLQDLEEDLRGLRVWLQEIEDRLQPLELHADWTTVQLHEQLTQHQVLQQDLEAHSKIVSAILKLCQRLHDTGTTQEGAGDKKLLATTLERRWHAILLQSLEWQCRLEEAIKNGIKKRPVIECPSSPESDDNQSLYTSYTSDQSSVYYPRSHGNGKYSDSDINDDGVESDTSNFDVIPFSESEYEKITVDTDVQTDAHLNGGVSKGTQSAFVKIPQTDSRRSPVQCEVMENGGTDSALGRSVSDHSINTDHGRTNISHGSIKLSHDKLKQAVTKVAVSREQQAMRAGQGVPIVVPKGSPKEASRGPLTLKVESHDIGYSSESHSTEEPDYSRYAEINGNIAPDQSADTQNVKLRGQSGKKTQDNAWRYSMTSAYDSSSNGSDHANNSHDDRVSTQQSGYSPSKNDMDPDLASQEKVNNLLSSPSRSFYHMTTIETDSEATSAGDRHIQIEESRSGAATDAESELSRSLELPYDDTPVRFIGDTPSPPVQSTRSRLDAVFENVEPLETPYGSPEYPAELIPKYRVLSDSDQSMDDEYVQMSDSGESNALFDMESMSRGARKSHNTIVQLSCEEADLSEGDIQGNDESVRDCVNRLLRQAKLLAQESKFGSRSGDENTFGRRKHKTKKQKNVAARNRSFTSTDGSALPTDDSAPSAPSMCEASGESTAESSDSEGEFSSTGSDSEENLYSDSLSKCKSAEVTLCGSPTHESLLIGSSSASEGQSLLLRRTRGKTRLSGKSGDLDLNNAQYSVSESAINDLKKQQLNETLQRSSTSQLPYYSPQRQSTPRRIRRRRLRKSGSDDIAGKLSISPAAKLTYSQSLPASRVHSSHSRSLSPSSLGLIQDQLLSSEEKAAEGVAIPGVKVISGNTDEDPLQHSLTSAAEFSENAWDNLHHIYPAMSSDPGEEKLDASEFHKDWDFQNNCNVENLLPHGVNKTEDNVAPSSGEKVKPTPREKRTHSTKLPASQSYAEDSDSDWEDIHCVIDESHKAIKFTENTLRKFRKDNMETGIFIDPSEYDGPLETCREHIVCLEEIGSVLDMKTAPDADLDEIRQINDMIGKWQALGALATARQKQSSCLARIYHDLISVKSSLQDVSVELDKDCYDSVYDLEHSIKVLQESKMQLHREHSQKVAALMESLTDFEDQYPDVKMARFDSEVAALQNRLDTAMDKCTARAAELQNILLSWYDFGETRRELEYLLKQEEEHLSCMDNTDYIVSQLFSVDDLSSTVHDLQALDTEMSHYEKKLQGMRAAQSEIAKVYSQTAHRQMKTNLQDLEAMFSMLRSNCRKMAAKVENQLKTADKQIQVNGAMQTAIDARLTSIAEMDSLTQSSGRSSLLWRLLKATLPIQLAIILGFSLLCLYDPSYSENLTGLVFNPALNYVDGPPPV